MSRPFLTATWSNLVLVTWEVEAGLLKPHLPPTLQLDLRDSMAFVSVVAFQFRNTRLRGVAVPGHTDVDEVNLRFYVRKPGYRGVTFIREFVPLPAVSLVARLFYNERYATAPMRGRIESGENDIVATYEVDYAGGTHSMTVSGQKPAFRPDNTAIECFLMDQQWGFGATRGGQMLRYEVEHPPWQIYTVGSYALDLDFAALYGEKWAVLKEMEPRSIIFSPGSEVTVWPARKIKLREELSERDTKVSAE
jgi:uncharacterized protein YqjF (DUF2071 family)